MKLKKKFILCYLLVFMLFFISFLLFSFKDSSLTGFAIKDFGGIPSQITTLPHTGIFLLSITILAGLFIFAYQNYRGLD